MSFITNLLGGTFESNRDEGDAMMAAGDFGSARMAYDRALKKGRGTEESLKEPVREKIARCRMELARVRLADAVDFAEGGDMDRAREYLADALQICDGEEIAAQVAALTEQFDAMDARTMAGGEEELSEEELLAIIAGTWSPLQAAEYARYPQCFHEALICGHDGDHQAALAGIKEAMGTVEEAQHRFVQLELARTFLAMDRTDEALAALQLFADRLKDEPEAEDEVLAAIGRMGQIHWEANRPKEAVELIAVAVTRAPENHVPHLNLGIFLRSQNELKRSLVSLEKARDRMGTLHPDMRVFRELGLTCLAMEQTVEAVGYLEAVIAHSAAQGVHDQYDPVAAIALARLYEERGDKDKACDLFRHLAEGYDTSNHFLYNAESARLLKSLERPAELVQRYLARAGELAKTNEEKAMVERLRTGGEQV